MFIWCISSDSEVLVKFCHGILKIIADVRKYWHISRYFLVFQVISRLWHIETSWFLHSMFILCITSDSEVLVKFCHGLLEIIANVRTIYSAYKTYTKVQLQQTTPFQEIKASTYSSRNPVQDFSSRDNIRHQHEREWSHILNQLSFIAQYN